MSRAGRAAAAPVALLDWLLVVAAAAGMLGLGTVAADIGFADGASTPPPTAVFGMSGDAAATMLASSDAFLCACGHAEAPNRAATMPGALAPAADWPRRAVAPRPSAERFIGEGPRRRELLLVEAENDPRWLLAAMAQAARERHGVGYRQVGDPFAGP